MLKNLKKLIVTTNLLLISSPFIFKTKSNLVLNKITKKYSSSFNKVQLIKNKKIFYKEEILKPNMTLDTNKQTQIKLPESLRGMKTLDHKLFEMSVKLPCLIFKDNDNINKVSHKLRSFLFQHKKVNNFINYNDPNVIIDEITNDEFVKHDENDIGNNKIVLLNPDIIKNYDDFGDTSIELMKEMKLTKDCFTHATIKLTYDNFKLDEILKAILPHDLKFSSYTQVGHIVHINFHGEVEEYKDIISQLLLDKIHTCKTVVSKEASIDNVYRNFDMKLLKGEENYVTLLKENGCSFKLDFSQVYWNSRLSTEHERVVKSLNGGDVVYDICAGIGPFSIPAARKGCFVLANDLNPYSIQWLKENKKLNGIKDDKHSLTITNKDAKDFIQNDIKDHLMKLTSTKDKLNEVKKIIFIMNLPASAIEFVPYFKMLTKEEYNKLIRTIKKETKTINEEHTELQQSKTIKTPELLLYLYCFLPKIILETKEKVNIDEELIKLFETNQVSFYKDNIKSLNFVRNVSPNKDMYKVIMILDDKYLVNEKRQIDDELDNEDINKTKVVKLSEGVTIS